MSINRRSSRDYNRGQIVVEYILLLVFSVSIAILITNQLVSRNSERPGLMTQKWRDIIQAIGSDYPDELKENEGE